MARNDAETGMMMIMIMIMIMIMMMLIRMMVMMMTTMMKCDDADKHGGDDDVVVGGLGSVQCLETEGLHGPMVPGFRLLR